MVAMVVAVLTTVEAKVVKVDAAVATMEAVETTVEAIVVKTALVVVAVTLESASFSSMTVFCRSSSLFLVLSAISTLQRNLGINS